MTEPLVLLPAMMCDARLYAPQIAALGRDYPVMVAPLLGERVEDMAAAILTAAPRRFALAGSDLGAMVAMDILRRAPDRVTRIALMSTTPLPESPKHAAAREPMMIAARSGRLLDVVDQVMPAQSFANGPDRFHGQKMLHQMATDLGPEAFVAQTRALQRRKDQQPTLRKIRQPAMILCGAEDTIYPVKRHQFMADLIPYATLKVIDGAGHFPTIEQPQAMTEALRSWLAEPLVLR